MRALKSSGSSRSFDLAVVAILAVVSSIAAWISIRQGWPLLDGDAEAHLNIARRLFDSRTPGPEQIGTAWLPLPHILMAPFAMNDGWWKSGAAGALFSALCFVIAGAFLFAAARRALGNGFAALAAALVFALNPNVLYLAAAPMTEMLFAASLTALLWATLWFRDSQSIPALLAAAVASNAGSLTRYEGWILIPFVSLYLVFAARRKWHAAVFAALAALGPLAWLAHNQYYFSNALEFYNGPWSAIATHQRQLAQGVVYPTDHNWRAAAQYYFEATRLVAGWPMLALGAVGLCVAAARRLVWPLVLLLLPPAFYIWSLHSGGADLYVPTLWPHTAYNTRYAVAALPLAALAASAIVTLVPPRLRLSAAIVLAAASLVPAPVCRQEAETNSRDRRAWTHEAAAYVAANYRPGSGILHPFGDLTAVLREAGIPLREALHDGNHPAWDAALSRPEWFLREEWALTRAGGEVAGAVSAATKHGRRYQLRRRIIVKGAPAVEIYHRE
jgi:hypothetical protein